MSEIPSEEPAELDPEQKEEVMSGSAATVQAMDAAANDPALKNVDVESIKDAVLEGKPNPVSGSPRADQLYKDLQDAEKAKQDAIMKATGMDLTGPNPFDVGTADKPNPVAVKNVGILRGLYERFGRACGLLPDEDPSTPEAQAKLAKAKADLENQAKTSTSAKSQIALGILSLLTTLAGIMYNIWKYDKVQDALAKLAAAFDSCSEVNYSTHTSKRLSCNNNDTSLSSKCKCDAGSTAAPDLGSLCTDFDPTHACGTYSYVFTKYSIYDLIASLIHGAEAAPGWIWAHKWYILGAVIVVILILVGLGLAKRYALSNASPPT